MTDEERPRRRRRGGRRRRSDGGAPATAERSEARPQQGSRDEEEAPPDWRWRTFPVFFAFALGMFVAISLTVLGLGFIVLYGSLFAVSFGLAHMIRRSVAARMRRR